MKIKRNSFTKKKNTNSRGNNNIPIKIIHKKMKTVVKKAINIK